MGAPRTFWAAVVGVYETTFVLLGANLAWLALNVPFFILLVALGLLLPGSTDASGTPQWLLVYAAWLLLFLPTPGATALGGLAQVAAGPDVARLDVFWSTLRVRWRLATICFCVSLVVLAALVWNIFFYASISTGVLRFATILWLYATLFWLGMHVYLVPLMLHVAEPRLLDLYRRAALVVLGHPLYTLVLTVMLLLVGLLSIVFLPAYVLLGGALTAMVQAHALREIRRRHGDLVPEQEEEVSRL